MKYDSKKDTLKHIGVVKSLLKIVSKQLKLRGMNHDKSKLGFEEKETFDKYTPLLRRSTYGSEEYKEHLKCMEVALRHHYRNNRHHPEFFKWNADDLKNMNLIDLTEMLCDWIAASRRHENGDIFKSIEINQKRFGYGDELKSILRHTAVTILAEEKL